MMLDRRVYLALAWGKWLAIRQEAYVEAIGWCEKKRGSRFGIAVNDDEWAARYQRLQFRIRRAMRAVGAWGLAGEATLGPDGWNWKSNEAIAAMNAVNFQKNERGRAHLSKQNMIDKRHPLALWEDHVADADYSAYLADIVAASRS